MVIRCEHLFTVPQPLFSSAEFRSNSTFLHLFAHILFQNSVWFSYQPRHPQQYHYLLQPQTCSTIHLTQQPLQSQEPHFHLPGLTLISSRFALVLGHQGRHAQCPHDQGQGQRCQCCRLTSVSSGIMLYNSVSSVSYLTQQIFSQGFIKISQEFPQIQYHRFPSYIITTCQLCFPGASIPDMQRNGFNTTGRFEIYESHTININYHLK